VKIWVIALNTFREAIRDKILYNLLFFALVIMGLSLSISNLTMGQQSKIVIDIGQAAVSIFGVLIAIFVGIQLVFKEIQRRTIYVLLSKPVSRTQFILGKYLGLLLTITVNALVMIAGFLLIVVGVLRETPGPILFWALLLTLVELALVTAVALLFSTFSTPMLSAMFTLGIYLIGHLSEDIRVYGESSKMTGLKNVTTAIYYLVPNLEHFNLRTEAVYLLPVDPGFILYSIVYGVAYSAFLLVLATVIFARRDFK
jgi:ABC-type transport system involved in multi-copper enzyme maturation permease subunit